MAIVPEVFNNLDPISHGGDPFRYVVVVDGVIATYLSVLTLLTFLAGQTTPFDPVQQGGVNPHPLPQDRGCVSVSRSTIYGVIWFAAPLASIIVTILRSTTAYLRLLTP